MNGSTPLLQNICVDSIINNATTLIGTHRDPDEKCPRYFWRNFPLNQRIEPQLSKKLMKGMRSRGSFKIELFSTDYAMLESFDLSYLEFNCHSCPPELLNGLTMRDLNMAYAKGITLNEAIFNMNEETRKNLTRLDISGMEMFDVSDLGRLSNLNSLNISFTCVTADDLRVIVKVCSHLKYLDISGTPIRDISCLLSLKDQLVGLIMHFKETPRRPILLRCSSYNLRLGVYTSIMNETTPSLQNICVDSIINNAATLIGTHRDPDKECPRYFWRNFPSNWRIVPQLSKKLMKGMRSRGSFKIELFSTDYTMLESFDLSYLEFNCHSCPPELLNGLTMRDLNMAYAKGITLNEAIFNMNEETRKNLTRLDISGMEMFDVSDLGRLSNLNSLNISFTCVTADDLRVIVKVCSHLKYLDISGTPIRDISCLLSLKDQLVGLIMHFKETPRRTINDLPPMTDVCSSGSLIHLKHFDICGNPLYFSLDTIREFIEKHPNIEFLGLAFWPDFVEAHDFYQLSLDYPHIVMSGDVRESLLLEKIRRYMGRDHFCTEMLMDFFTVSPGQEIGSPKILETVLDLVDEVPNSKTTRELYQETLLCLAEYLYAVDLTGALGQRVMESVLDYIIRFDDGYRFLRLLMNKHNLMPDGTYRNIESNSLFTQYLIRYINEMCPCGERLPFHRSMNFSLIEPLQENPVVVSTILKSLRRSEVARTVFHKTGSLKVLGRIENIWTFSTNPTQYTAFSDPILRILHLYSKEEGTGRSLLNQKWVNYLCLFLYGPSFERSYIASQIICNLLSFAPEVWSTLLYFNKNDLLETLGKAICRWKPPFILSAEDIPSLAHLEKLLFEPTSRLEVKLWVLWTIRHLLSRGQFNKAILSQHLNLKEFLNDVVSSPQEKFVHHPKAPSLNRKEAKMLERYLTMTFAERMISKTRAATLFLQGRPYQHDLDRFPTLYNQPLSSEIYMQAQRDFVRMLKKIAAELLAIDQQ
nr:protein zyg [Hymenolepis microstoma]